MCKHYACAVLVGQMLEGYTFNVCMHVQSKSFFQVSCMFQEIFISCIISLCTRRMQTGKKRFYSENHASRVSEKTTQTRRVTFDISTYNTVHFCNPPSL